MNMFHKLLSPFTYISFLSLVLVLMNRPPVTQKVLVFSKVIDHGLFLLFFLNYEGMITHLQETCKLQNKVTYSSTIYCDFLSR